ncbi:GNAT family N-acetyltransferase [Paenibacillus humicola]|uniref:GNAT family N-acetyltransferase n=1 Tax=Paenibacillus humicola TaxID=3110540 RepID=UPI00237C379C|nr:GNAT family N-acetyltransferase [Paenibacillus humicola]
MNVIIRPVLEDIYSRIHEFQCEYLDRESFAEFAARVRTNPGCYLTAFDEEELAGICYGQPSRKDRSAFAIQGIAVNLDANKSFARRGIGSLLVREIETIAMSAGFRRLEAGSADDPKVEAFYLKNGFDPFELVAKGPAGEEYERVGVSSCAEGSKTRAVMREKHRQAEVIYIFMKRIG